MRAVQAFDAYPAGVVNSSLAATERVSTSAATAAECQSLVRQLHPTANGATYSNDGEEWCKAVFNA